MRLNFRNRIALYYLIATAVIVGLAFGVIFIIVKGTVYQNLDADLSFEAKKHSKEIEYHDGKLSFVNKSEWEEHEHREVQVNPVFIQLVDIEGNTMDKSPNLKEEELPFKHSMAKSEHLDTRLNDKEIRIVQIPITASGGEIRGYILAAVTLRPARIVIENLKKILLLSFGTLLLILFLVSRFLAGRSIAPIRDITTTASNITRHNLSERVPLPANQDELYDLSSSINELLERMENAMKRERQFTSDASHELRTPLASLRGTLEVLIRKDRTVKEYVDKIKVSLGDIDRMSKTIEQLLLLARLDENLTLASRKLTDPALLMDSVLLNLKEDIEDKELTVEWGERSKEIVAGVPEYFALLILENAIGNAVKYSKIGGALTLSVKKLNDGLEASVTDNGLGIKKEDLPYVFNPLFRSDPMQHREIEGNGLGLSIVQKAAKAIGAEVFLSSEINKGTTFRVIFK